MKKFEYSKKNLLRLFRSSDYLCENFCFSEPDSLFLEIRKNAGDVTKYSVILYRGEKVFWVFSGNNYEEAVEEFHAYVRKNGLIPETSRNETDGESATASERLKDKPANQKRPSPKNTRNPTDSAKRGRKSRTAQENGKRIVLHNLIRAESHAKEVFRIFGDAVDSMEILQCDGTAYWYSRPGELLGTYENNPSFWKGVILTLVSEIPERVRTGKYAPETVIVRFNGSKSLRIYVHNLFAEGIEIDEGQFPFLVCDYEDWYLNQPALRCWLEDLFRSYGIETVEGVAW